MTKKGSAKRDKGVGFDVFNEIQEPGASLDDLLHPLDETFFDGPLVPWDGSVLDDLLPPGDDSVLDALLPPTDASFLDGLLLPPNEIVPELILDDIHDAMIRSDLRHEKRPRRVGKRRPRRTRRKPR
jgi:hypothetical protein